LLKTLTITGYTYDGRFKLKAHLALYVEIVAYHLDETMTPLLIHPGEHLADELKALGMSANELAKELGVPTNRIMEIIRGKNEEFREIQPCVWADGLEPGRISE
jgi:hypothetical protein